MKRKIFNSLLLLTTFVAAMSVFVSCKDYDDDINDLRNQITTNATDLQSLLTERINNVNTEITNLQTQAANLQTAYDAADKQLQANIDALDAAVAIQIASASNDAEDYADAAAAAAEAAAKAYADVQAAEAQKAAIEAAQSLVDDAVAKLEVQLEAAIQDAAEGLASLQGYVDAQDASLQAQIDAAITAANDSHADLQNQIDAITAAIDAVSSELATKANSSDLDALKEKVEEYYNELIAADAKLEEGIATAQADANTANNLANQALTLAQTNEDAIEALKVLINNNQTDLSGQISNISGKIETIEEAIAANETAIGNLEITVGGLNEIVEDLQGQISTIGTTASNALTQANENLASIKSLEGQLTSLAESNEEALEAINTSLESLGQSTSTNAENIEKLELALTALQTTVEENQTAIEEMLAEEVEALKGDIAAAVIEAEAYADAVAAAAAEAVAEALEKAVDDLTLSISAVESAYQSADKDLQDNIDALSDQLTAVAEDLKAGIDALNDALSLHETEMEEALKAYATTSDLATLQTTLEGLIGSTATDMLEQIVATYATIETTDDLQDAIDAINKKIEAIGEGSFDELLTTIKADEKAIEALQAEVETINKYLGLALQRLKSLVFAPTTYFNGIECIKFATLSYVDWGDNLYADAAPDNGKEITVSDDSHTEEYLVSPSNVTLESIASLSFVANDATDDRTRTVSPDAPIEVAASSISSDGVLTLNLKKTGTTSFGMDPDNFTIVALKAVIAESYLTDDEKEAGEEVAVYSDWARLCEISTTPYIHNAQAVDQGGKLDEEAADAHFWAFSDIYGENGDVTTTVIDPDDIKVFIIEPYLDYQETLDLSEYSIICDKNGNTYDPEAYGFSFEYNVVPCLVGDETSSVDQSLYASIDEDNVLTPVGGTAAINKTPVIQVVLKDDNNGAVVDVRYFVIKIYDKDAQKDFGPLDTDTLEYACGGVVIDNSNPAEPVYGYSMDISAYIVQQMYESYDMTEEVFFDTYTELTGLYASKEEADKVLNNNGATTDPALGTLVLNADNSLTWTIEYSDALLKATDEDYANGYMEVDAWAVFANATAENIVTFELTLRLEIDELALADNANKNQTYWTTSGKRVFNPELESDAVYGSDNYQTTMMLGNLLEGYLINNGTSAYIPTSTLDLVNKGDEVAFVFDQKKFKAEVPDSTQTDPDDWTFSADGTSVYYQGVPAATIITEASGKCYVQLYEGSTPGQPGEPSDGAKLLVDIDLPIMLVDTWCDLNATVDSYYVAFLEPLDFSDPIVIPIDLIDLQEGGSDSDTQLDGTIEIKEKAAVNGRVVWDNADPTKAVAGLAEWYGVEEPVYDIDNAMTDLQLNGKLGADGCNIPLSSFTKTNEETGDEEPIYRLDYDPATNKIVFYNDSGSALSQAIHIEVYVTIKTKWQDATVAKLEITVSPGHDRNVKHQ